MVTGWEIPAAKSVLDLLKSGLAILRERKTRKVSVERVSFAIRELLKENPDVLAAEAALGSVSQPGEPVPAEVLRAQAMLANARKAAQRQASAKKTKKGAKKPATKHARRKKVAPGSKKSTERP